METPVEMLKNGLFCLVCGLYLLPLVIASVRKHKNHVAISVLNVFFGFTVIGWIAALIWSLTNTSGSRS